MCSLLSCCSIGYFFDKFIYLYRSFSHGCWFESQISSLVRQHVLCCSLYDLFCFCLVWFGGGAPIIPMKGLARRGGPAARSWFPLSYLPSEEIGLWLAWPRSRIVPSPATLWIEGSSASWSGSLVFPCFHYHVLCFPRIPVHVLRKYSWDLKLARTNSSVFVFQIFNPACSYIFH